MVRNIHTFESKLTFYFVAVQTWFLKYRNLCVTYVDDFPKSPECRQFLIENGLGLRYHPLNILWSLNILNIKTSHQKSIRSYAFESLPDCRLKRSKPIHFFFEPAPLRFNTIIHL